MPNLAPIKQELRIGILVVLCILILPLRVAQPWQATIANSSLAARVGSREHTETESAEHICKETAPATP